MQLLLLLSKKHLRNSPIMDDIHIHDTNGYLLTIKAQLDAGQEYYNIRCEFQQLQ